MLVLLLLCAPGLLFAQDDETSEALSNTEKLGVMDRMHQYLTGEVIDTSEWVDRFLGKERVGQEQNLSFARLRLDFEEIEEFGSDVKPRLRARVRFTKEGRTSIGIGRDEDGIFDPSGGDGGTIFSPNFDESDEADSAIALGYDLVRTSKNKLSFSAGFRRREDTYQDYLSAKYYFRKGFAENWVFHFRNKLYDFSRSGIENTADLTFERTFGKADNILFRYNFSTRYRDTEPGYFLHDRLSVYHITSPKTMWGYELLGYYQTEDDPETGERRDGNELWLRYRRNFYRPWMFGEIRPMVGWPAERDFDTTWGILLRLELFFGRQAAYSDRLKEIN